MEDAKPPPPTSPRGARRVLLVLGGTLALLLGIVGAIVPLLPTAPFVLLAAGCYVRAWPAGHRWLREHRLFGPMVRSGAEGRYLPPRAKRWALTITTLSFVATLTWALEQTAPRIAVGALGCGVLLWLARVPTTPPAHGGSATAKGV